MVKAGYIQDDNVVIPEDIKNMTKEEKQREIARLEAEMKERHARFLQERELTAV
jgi:hypothetical protein